MKYDHEEIGRIIREERKKLGWTQDKLGEILYISGKQISNYEKGSPLPSLETMLKLAELFNCELGYLLGEESYSNRTRLNTSICESLGLSAKAVDSLRAATHKGLTQTLPERQQAISRFFESPFIGDFFDCLVDAVSVSDRITKHADTVFQNLVDQFGEQVTAKATLFFSTGLDISTAEQNETELENAMKEFDASIDEARGDEFTLKVARYELREVFEMLVRNIL